MKTILIASLLLLSVFALSTEEQATFDRMEKSRYGKTILDTIALQIQAGDPADDLIHMLQGLEDKLQDEQDVADDAILVLQNQCVEDLALLVEEIAATRKRIQELSDLLAALKPIRADKESEKADLEDFLALLIEKLAQIEEAKAAKDAEWKEEAEQHDSQIAIIQRVKDLFVASFQASFLQVKKVDRAVFVEVSEHLKKARKMHFKNKGVTSIFRVLSQITASQEIQAAGSAIEKVIALCDQILDKLAESRAIEKADYDHWVAEYNQTKTKLTEKKVATEARIAQLTIDIAVLTKRINAAEAEYAEQVERLALKISQHDEREAFCDAAGKAYAHEREERDDQRAVISDAIGLLTAKIRLLKRYVSDRVVNLDKPVL